MVFHGCHRKKSFFLFVGTDDKVDNVAFTKMERAVIFETKRVETIIFHYLGNLKDETFECSSSFLCKG